MPTCGRRSQLQASHSHLLDRSSLYCANSLFILPCAGLQYQLIFLSEATQSAALLSVPTGLNPLFLGFLSLCCGFLGSSPWFLHRSDLLRLFQKHITRGSYIPAVTSWHQVKHESSADATQNYFGEWSNEPSSWRSGCWQRLRQLSKGVSK
eukprot:c19678_g3_i1 orf=130-582(+)